MQVVSEGPVKITKATIDAAWRRRGPDGRLIIRDRDCRGLSLIVNATSMTWSYAYRPRGTDPGTWRRWPNRTVTLGNPATHSPDDARIAANRIKGEAAAGGDPAVEKRAQAEVERRQRSAKLGRLAEEYGRAFTRRQKMRGTGLPSPTYVANELAQVRLALQTLQAQELSAAALTDADVRRLLDATSDQGSIARKRFGALSRFMDWCHEAGHIAANPCLLVPRTRRPKAPQARSHYLSLDALAHIWRAADGLRDVVWRDIARFLIAVPCRRAEGAKLDWSHLDLDAAEWRQPGHLTKNRDPHRLHLHPLALAILRTRHEAASRPKVGLVFPAPVSRRPVTNFHDLKVTLSKNSGVTGWAWHDTRRSFATALGEAGIPETVADAILNHRQSATRGGVLGVYQRASRWPEQVRAMDLWGKLLAEAITGGEAPANVVPMVARAG